MKGLPTPDIIDKPFGADDTSRPKFEFEGDSATTYPISNRFGIPRSYSVPKANGGVSFTRHDMNQLGYLSTLSTYLNQIGYGYEWNEKYMQSIDGYPKGALLKLIVWNSEHTRPIKICDIISLIENNRYRPVYNFEDPEGDIFYGEMIDKTTGEPVLRNDAWAIVDQRKNYNFFPDYSKKTLLWDIKVNSSMTIDSPTLGGDGPCWYYVERTIGSWDDLSGEDRILKTPNVEVRIQDDSSSPRGNPLIGSIQGFEGRIIGKMIAANSFYIHGQYDSVNSVSGELSIRAYKFDMLEENN